ncbi:ABC transporter permease [Arthrospiribacter ruber]|uniref:ABC transporter permease n=1 Tax=Arthrospiribacter ruber TaxID=2487934 RepID=A0A951IVE8_9BACT|nr:ABC transporter permease [Arthrospiribacter ruber]MBW3467032.1 ABC transporter permease [Arthrospiribacter ruber]
MLRNYLKIAWRNLLKTKAYSFINIFGLVLGMGCSLIIGLWAFQEISFNKFFPDGNLVYKVRTNYLFNGELLNTSMTPAPLAEALKEEVPQIEYAVKIADWGPQLLIKDEKNAFREKGIFASDDFFNIFQMKVISGNPVGAHHSGEQLVISQSVSKKLFGDKSALGEFLMMENQEGNLKTYMVGAVIEDVPANSSVQFDWVVNFKEIEQPWMGWGNTSYTTFVKVLQNTSGESLESVAKNVYANHSDYGKDNYPIFQPLAEIHLFDVFENGKAVGGRISLVRNLSLIGLLILLVSCINFVSLVTARASVRGKEIGIRKVIGANKKALLTQFGYESLLVSAIALMLTLLVVNLVLPLFNSYLGTQLTLEWGSLGFYGIMFAIWLVASLMSSLYPSVFLANLPVFNALKQQVNLGWSGSYFRKSLIVGQFFISSLFIVGIMVFYSQQEFLRKKDLGLERENVLYLPLAGELYHNMEVLQHEAIKSTAIVSATVSTFLPINIQAHSGDLSWPGKAPDLQTHVSAAWVGYDFAKTMGITLKEGREFSPLHPGDSLAYLVNQKALDLMGIEENAIGEEISFWNGPGQIIGVMEDFHLQSLHSPITPLILVLEPENASYLLVRTAEGRLEQAISDLRTVSESINPAYPFEYHFLDQEYERLYLSEQMIGRLILIFGIVAIFISCLGLLGMTAFTVSRKVKEIGIRKVLGASIIEVAALISKSFLGLIFLGWIIALPVAWMLMDSWLDNFAYKIDLQWWYFIGAGALTMLIALFTVSFQSVKAALMNPVDSLRSE